MIIFEETGEVRQAKQGEWFLDNFQGVFERRICAPTSYSHTILTRTVISNPSPELRRMIEEEKKNG